MLSELLTEPFIQVTQESLNWKEAIELAARPLLESQKILPQYLQAIYQKAEEFGPFFDIGKNIAIPHARSEEGVLITGLSYLRCLQPVNLLDKDDHPIEIFIMIAAADNKSHLLALSKLSEILIDNQKVEQLKSLTQPSEIASFFRKEDNQ